MFIEESLDVLFGYDPFAYLKVLNRQLKLLKVNKSFPPEILPHKSLIHLILSLLQYIIHLVVVLICSGLLSVFLNLGYINNINVMGLCSW